MRYLSVCSGIGATEIAFGRLGWDCVGVSEIDPLACKILAYRFPHIKNLGDFTQIEPAQVGTIDLLVGGTPCQDFSLAGLRAGLDGERGKLTIEFIRLAQRLRPRWIVWENVRGILSSDQGRAFGTFLGALEECGYGFAYRVLDSQFFNVPQQRRRVFLVGHFGDWRPPAAVLFESTSLRGDTPPGSSQEEITSAFTASSLGGGGPEYKAAKANHIIAFSCRDYAADASNVSPTLRSMAPVSSSHNGGGQVAIASGDTCRRLTPRECERLQGFPDDHCLVPVQTTKAGKVKWTADGPRYRTIGNAMTVPVMEWLGARIEAVDQLKGFPPSWISAVL